MRHLRLLLLLCGILSPLITSCSTANRFNRHSKNLSSFPSDLINHGQSIPPLVNQKSLVILDAGHGGTDEGAKVKSFMEKQVALATTLFTKKYLEEMGYRVILTRSRDIFVSLGHRVSIANKTQGAVFVSIHYNAHSNPTAKGIEVYYCKTSEADRTRDSHRLANCILPCLVDQTDASSRGVKQAKFLVIKDTQMPAVLVEGGFVTNPEERALLKEKPYQEKIAKGIAEGIDKFLKS